MNVGRFVTSATIVAFALGAVLLNGVPARADDMEMSFEVGPVAGSFAEFEQLPILSVEEQLANEPLLGGPDPAKGDIGQEIWEPIPRPSEDLGLRGLRVDECCSVGSFAQPISNTSNFFHGNVIGVLPSAVDGAAYLRDFSVELRFTGSAQLTFTVYHFRRDISCCRYEPVAIRKVTYTGNGTRTFYSSGEFNPPLELSPDTLNGQPVIAYYALGIGWEDPLITYGRSTGEDLPDPFCVGTIQGYWGLDQNPPSIGDTGLINLPSPLYTRGALSMDICFAGPPAACCLPDGTCVDVDQPNICELQGGEFTRGGVQCPGPGAPNLCPLPKGACCFGDGICDYTTEYRCEDEVGGTWQEGRECAPHNPCRGGTGACCLPDGSCVDDMLPGDCLALDGLFTDEDKLCADPSVTCLPRGACCLAIPGLRGENCDVRLESECAGGNVYQGDGTHCPSDPYFPFDPCDETLGACCLYDGGCLPAVTEYACWDNPTGYPGSWTAGASCAAADCDENVLGACCDGTTCIGDETVDECLGCVDVSTTGSPCPGGMFMTTNGPCPDTGYPGECMFEDIDWFEGQPCDYGACLSEGAIGPCCVLGECQVTTELECQVLGGIYGGNAGSAGFMACNDNGYPAACSSSGTMGACCLTDSMGEPYCKLLSSAECATTNGWFSGEGIACTGLICAIGNCCDAMDQCTETRKLECANPEDWKSGQHCSDGPYSPNPCLPIGACCFYEGQCDELNEVQCINLGGTYQGDETECSPSLCPPPPEGACCYNDTTCAYLEESECDATGGTFQGDGVECTEGLCPAVGACCHHNGVFYTCSLEEEDNCLNVIEGEFAGAGSTCLNSPCQFGACCELDGTCTEEFKAACALNDEGVFLGNGSTCSAASCPARGACCLGTNGCAELTLAECNSNGGQFNGVGVPCDSTICEEIACCLPSGNCRDKIVSVCASSNGFAGLPGQTCSSGDLCTEGACCVSGGCGPANQLQCQSVGGQFKGAGTLCDTPGICDDIRACCVPGDGCRDLLVDYCIASNGVIGEPGQLCSSGDLCTPGACCLQGGGAANACDPTKNQLECQAELTFVSFQGAGAMCTPDPCNTGLCCLLDGMCEDDGGNGLMEIDCAAWPGAEFVAGQECATYTCTDKCAAYTSYDFDGDGTVDLADFAAFQRCFGTPSSASCLCVFDADEDGDVDILDFEAFQTQITGPNVAKGACCRLNGLCEDDGGAGLASSACTQWGGSNYVPGGTCGSMTCPDVCAGFPGSTSDFDGSGSVNLWDFSAFQLCFGANPGDECMCVFDDNENGNIDLADFAAFALAIESTK